MYVALDELKLLCCNNYDNFQKISYCTEKNIILSSMRYLHGEMSTNKMIGEAGENCCNNYDDFQKILYYIFVKYAILASRNVNNYVLLKLLNFL